MLSSSSNGLMKMVKSNCILWKGAVNKKGYGVRRIAGYKVIRANSQPTTSEKP